MRKVLLIAAMALTVFAAAKGVEVVVLLTGGTEGEARTGFVVMLGVLSARVGAIISGR
jgi:hypothetical protein